MTLHALFMIALLSSLAEAAKPVQPIQVEIKKIDSKGVHESIGTIRFRDTRSGLEIAPSLKGLSPGKHGFHVHSAPSCEPGEKDGKIEAGIAAGPHLDPNKSGAHAGPKGEGHLGDLPALEVSADGTAKKKMIAPRLKLADLAGRSIMIHEGGDNYSDQPKSLGGGGARIACGAVR